VGTVRGKVKDRILDAALAVLRESATRRFAQPIVARTAGVPQGHLTYYFPKKLDLLIAVAKRYTQLVAKELTPFLRGRKWHDATEQERQDARAFVTKLVKDRERTRMLVRLVAEADADPGLRDAVAEGAWFSRGALARILDVEDDHPDVDVAFAIFWGLGLQYLVFRDRRTEADLDAALDIAFEHLESMSQRHHPEAPIRKPTTRPPPPAYTSHPFDHLDSE
jgi:AcrR family transcriptional regulator